MTSSLGGNAEESVKKLSCSVVYNSDAGNHRPSQFSKNFSYLIPGQNTNYDGGNTFMKLTSDYDWKIKLKKFSISNSMASFRVNEEIHQSSAALRMIFIGDKQVSESILQPIVDNTNFQSNRDESKDTYWIGPTKYLRITTYPNVQAIINDIHKAIGEYFSIIFDFSGDNASNKDIILLYLTEICGIQFDEYLNRITITQLYNEYERLLLPNHGAYDLSHKSQTNYTTEQIRNLSSKSSFKPNYIASDGQFELTYYEQIAIVQSNITPDVNDDACYDTFIRFKAKWDSYKKNIGYEKMECPHFILLYLSLIHI